MLGSILKCLYIKKKGKEEELYQYPAHGPEISVRQTDQYIDLQTFKI